MDTDSMYFALSGKTLDEVIKPNMKEAYYNILFGYCHQTEISPLQGFWFPRQCCQEHHDHDMFSPGLFKLEFIGLQMVGLCSTTYAAQATNGQVKFSCKGVNKKRVGDPLEQMTKVLETRTPASCINVGFRAKDNQVFTYEEGRQGFSYLYCKRRLCDDGIHTVPLDITLNP